MKTTRRRKARARERGLARSPSARNIEVLAAIRHLFAEFGYAPSMAEIAHRAGLSARQSVDCHLIALERLGFIARAKGKARAIRMLRGVA